jgi:3-oxoacyl-[acyl-carrier-protein] synthase II
MYTDGDTGMNGEPRRVVITGMGIICPLGNDLATVWPRLIAGESGIDTIKGFDASRISARFAGEVKGFDANQYMDKRAARRMDAYARYAVAAGRQAVEDAGLDIAAEPEHIGAVVASGVGGLFTFQEQTRVLLEKGPDRVNPLFIPMMIPNMGAAHVSLELGVKGPVSAVCTACAAGSNAIGDAFEIIRRGDAVAMLAGGAEAAVNETGVAAFAAMRALSTRNDAPQEGSRPFDAGRDGFVMGEGGAILVLEELEHAAARGARIYAEVAGYGMSADAFHLTLPDETGEAQARAMSLALKQAGFLPSMVDYVNAHGTSTPAGDISETRAMKVAFGSQAPNVPISSTKSMTGHLLGGAGAIEAVFCVKTILDGVIPPTINLTDPDPECDLDYVPNVAREATVNVAMSNSFGFGGHDVSLVFKRFEG